MNVFNRMCKLKIVYIMYLLVLHKPFVPQKGLGSTSKRIRDDTPYALK